MSAALEGVEAGAFATGEAVAAGAPLDGLAGWASDCPAVAGAGGGLESRACLVAHSMWFMRLFQSRWALFLASATIAAMQLSGIGVGSNPNSFSAPLTSSADPEKRGWGLGVGMGVRTRD